MKRVKIRDSGTAYHIDKYKFLPKFGYTKMFEKMIKDSHVYLNTDFRDLEMKKFKNVFITISLDELYNQKLDFRGLDFDIKTFVFESNVIKSFFLFCNK